MENQQILMKEKLGFSGIIKEALKVFAKRPKFIVVSFLASLPLFCSLLLHESVVQHALMETIQVLTSKEERTLPSFDGIIRTHYLRPDGLYLIKELVRKVFPKLLRCGLMYLGTVHVLDLLNTIVIVGAASEIYARENSFSLKEMVFGTIKKVGFQGPFTTSIYVLLFASLTSLGLLTLATDLCLPLANSWDSNLWGAGAFYICLLGSLFIALLTKHIEWSAIWNTGLVLSVLGERHGYIAIGVSAHLTGGSRKRGFLLMLVFFFWRVALRGVCVYICWYNRGCGTAVTVMMGLACLGNVMKWVVFMVYFYDCKKRFLEKKIDAEEGKAASGGTH